MSSESSNTVKIVFPSNEIVKFYISDALTVSNFLEIVCHKIIGIYYPQIFGLKYRNCGEFFLENDKTFYNQEIKPQNFTFYLSLKYHVPSINMLKTPKLLAIFYSYCLQILTKNTVCVSNYEKILLQKLYFIAGYQIATINFSSICSENLSIIEKRPWCHIHEKDSISCSDIHVQTNDKAFFVNEYHIDIQNEYSERLFEELLVSFDGISKELAMLGFVGIMEHVDGYGYNFYEAVNNYGDLCQLAITPKGLSECSRSDSLIILRSFNWQAILNISYRKQKFSIEYKSENNLKINKSCVNLDKGTTSYEHCFWILCNKMLFHECILSKKFYEQFDYEEMLNVESRDDDKVIDHLVAQNILYKSTDDELVTYDMKSFYTSLLLEYDRIIKSAIFQENLYHWIHIHITHKLKSIYTSYRLSDEFSLSTQEDQCPINISGNRFNFKIRSSIHQNPLLNNSLNTDNKIKRNSKDENYDTKNLYTADQNDSKNFFLSNGLNPNDEKSFPNSSHDFKPNNMEEVEESQEIFESIFQSNAIKPSNTTSVKETKKIECLLTINEVPKSNLGKK